MIVLGIETSCDETAAAVVTGERRILADEILSQWDRHRPFGGIVPEIAARAHLEHIDTLIARAMEEAGVAYGDLDGVAATGGPGLIGGVMVGVTTAKAIALAHGQIVGTGRLVSRDDGDGQVGRMAVDQPWRRQGVGGLILQHLETEARSQGMLHSILHAQEYVKDFYAAHGYQEYGDLFLNVDIPHIEMRKAL